MAAQQERNNFMNERQNQIYNIIGCDRSLCAEGDAECHSVAEKCLAASEGTPVLDSIKCFVDCRNTWWSRPGFGRRGVLDFVKIRGVKFQGSIASLENGQPPEMSFKITVVGISFNVNINAQVNNMGDLVRKIVDEVKNRV
jgi:hypothetical protein